MKVLDFEVDLESYDELKTLLHRLIKDFDSLIFNDGGGFTFQFGQMQDGKMNYHGPGGIISYSCFPFIEAVCKHEDLQDDAEKFLHLLIERNDGQEKWDRATWTDEHPFGLYASFALILANKKYVQTHIELLRTFDRDHIFDQEQTFTNRFIAKWGYCDELLHLMAARLMSILTANSAWHFDELLGDILSPLMNNDDERSKFYNYLLKDNLEEDYRFQKLPGEYIFGELIKGINEFLDEEVGSPEHLDEFLKLYDARTIQKFDFEICKIERFFKDRTANASDGIKIESKRNLFNPSIYRNNALNVQLRIPMGFQMVEDVENKAFPKSWEDDRLHILDHRKAGQVQFMNLEGNNQSRIIIMLAAVKYKSANAFFKKAEADGAAYLKSIEDQNIRMDYNYNYHSMETPDGFDGYQSVEQIFYEAPKNKKVAGRLWVHMFLKEQTMLGLYFDLMIGEDEILETVESVKSWEGATS